MKIQSLHFKTFKNYKWDVNVKDFHDKVNVVLGWNGVGKTIVSRALRSFEKGKIESEDKIYGATFVIGFDTGTKKQSELSGNSSQIRVFNEDFIRESIGQTHLPYVVAIGSAEVDFSKKQKELDQATDQLSKFPKCKNEFDAISKKVSESIRLISGIGHIKKDPVVESSGTYNSYSKSSFEKRIVWLAEQVEQGKEVEGFVCAEGDLGQMLATLSNLSEKEREYKIHKKWNDWSVEKLEKINTFLQFVPTYEKSLRLAKYSDGGSEEKWIRDGLEVHKLNDEGNQSINCLFCGSEITNKDELLKHFSKEVIELNNALDAMSKSVESALNEISTCKIFYASVKTSLKGFFVDLQMKIQEKRVNITEPVSKIPFEGLFDKEELFDAASTAWSIEASLVANEYIKYVQKKEEFESYEKECSLRQEEIEKIDGELKELKKAAKDVQIPADRINRLLRSTFPYKKIELDDSEDEVGYALKRDDVECGLDSLSEGERNFLALAYFLLSINDEDEKIDADAIVVIDDPVSSLDSDSLFQVYAILSGEMERNSSRQYFLFTHNLDFFGHLLQNYKKNGKVRDELVNLYQIGLTETGASIQELDEGLRNYRSDYMYAITKLNKIKDSSSLDDAILAANLLRRALETFLHFKYGHGNLRSKLAQLYAKYRKYKLENSDPTQKAIIEVEISQDEKAMYRFINHGSHEFLGLEKCDITALQGSKQRIENLFEVIKRVDVDHYNTFNFDS